MMIYHIDFVLLVIHFFVFTADGFNFFTDNPVFNYGVWKKGVFKLGAGGLVWFIF